MKTLKQAGEFGWISMAKKYCVGIGDDAAVLPAGKKDLLLTTDMLLEGKHFFLREARGFEIGWKAMAVNLSDIAAMGGVPRAAVVSLGAPASTPVAFLKKVYRGMKDAAGRFGAEIVGGDTNASERLTIAVTLLGEVEKGKAVLRSGAKTGDWIFVTGSLGGSYGSKKHLCFTPRLREACWLAKNFRLHAMMDISDGLASDIHRIAEQSHVGVVLNESAVPVSRNARSVKPLTDGEDFELLFTLSPKEGSRLMRRPAPKGFPAFTHVGWIVRGGRVEILRKNGRLEKLTAKGFDHYR